MPRCNSPLELRFFDDSEEHMRPIQPAWPTSRPGELPMRADIETMAPGGRVCVAPPVLAGDAPARSIGDYLGIVWRRRYLALGVIATCTLAAYTGARFMRPVYRAAISIVVEKKPGIDLFGGQPGPDAAAAEAQFQTELELLQSRSVVRRARSE